MRNLYDIKPARKEKSESATSYVRREEVLFDNKRYRLYNNYLTLSVGTLATTITRHNAQKLIAGDYHFHVKKHYFQTGLMMSGDEFFSNNNIELHVGYGLRRERNKTNFAIFGGPTLYTGVTGTRGVNDPSFYDGVGAYLSLQAVAKVVSYDVGIGAELFGEISAQQKMVGIKFLLFFSGAYRGLEKNYNPNVRAQNPNLK